MKYLLLSITLLISSSSVALASNSYQNNIQTRGVTHGQNFLNYNSSLRNPNTRQQRIETVERRVRHKPQFRSNVQPRVNNFQPRVNHRQPIQKHFQPRANYVQPRVDIRKKSRFTQAENAARRGHPQAEFDLAMMYAKGNGVQRNPRVAFNLFHRAARKGHIDAKYCMAVNFDKGYGVIQQKELARHWYGIAAKAGHRGAQKRLAQLNQPIQQNQGLIRNARYSRR